MGTKRGQGEGSITRRGDRWVARISTPAGRRQLGTFDTKAEAREAIRVTGATDVPASSQSHTPLVDYLTGTWIVELAAYCKPVTISGYAGLVRAYVAPYAIGGLPLQALTEGAFRQHFAALLRTTSARTGQRLSSVTVRKVDGMLRTALGQAVADGLIARNPIPTRRVPAQPRPRVWITTDELSRLLWWCRRYDPELEVPVRLMALAGLRRGEVCGLRWRDVDATAGVVHIRMSRTLAFGRVVETAPKTAASAAGLQVGADTFDALARHHSRRGVLLGAEVPADEHVMMAGTRPWNPDAVGRRLRDVLTHHNAEHPDAPIPLVSPHGLRHSYASNLVAGGVNLRVVQAGLRHATIRLTADLYSHVVPAQVAEANATLEAALRRTDAASDAG
jgi:integrase